MTIANFYRLYIVSHYIWTLISAADPVLKWSNSYAGTNYPMMPTQVNLSANKTHLYVSGYHAGPIFGKKCQLSPVAICCYLIKFDVSNGKIIWVNFWGNGNNREWAGGQIVDPVSDIPTVGGYTNDNLDGQLNNDQNLLSNDLYLLKFDKKTGNRTTKLFGTPGDDVSHDLKVDSERFIYYCGWTTGRFANQLNAGGFDNFLLKLDHNYTLIWARQWGTPTDDFAFYLELSNNNKNIWVAGIWNSGFHPHPFDIWRPVLKGLGRQTSGKSSI
jgi:hypothetical protein